jgi:hypothetical protein
MASLQIDRLIGRFQRASGEAKHFWEAYKKAAEFAAPQINDFQESKGQTKQPGVNNSQVLRSTNAFVCEVISSLTPPNIRWMELHPTSNLIDSIVSEYSLIDSEEAEKSVKKAYEEITKKFFECLDSSNFYAVEDKFVRAIGIGTGCLLINEIPFGKRFKNSVPFEFIYVPISNLSLDAGNNGKIYGVFREMKVRLEEIQELWFDATVPPEYDAVLPRDDTVLPQYDSDGASARNLVECRVYAPDREFPDLDWVFCVFDPQRKLKIVNDRRLSYNPYVVFRWNTIENESMGRGVILDALGDILQLDRLQKVFNEWIQCYALGALLVDNSEMTELDRFYNGALQVGKPIGVNDVNNIRTLPIGGNLNAQQFLLAETTNAIRQQLLDIELPMEQQMTAYETQVRAQKIMKLFSATFGRINLEFIEPIVKICLKLMAKHGIIKIPEQVGDINQFTTKIVLKSPLSKTQQMADIESIRVALETVSMVQSPLVAQQINMDRFFRFVWEGAGAPLHVLNTGDEVAAQRQETMREQMVLAQSGKMNFME